MQVANMGILAYIDPGSGSLLLQAALAALLSVPFFFRRTIGGAWRRLRGRPDPVPASTAAASVAADDAVDPPEESSR